MVLRMLELNFSNVICIQRMGRHIQTMADHWVMLVICLLVVRQIQVHAASWVNVTIVDSSMLNGAACLDGSPPAYFIQRGFGEGKNNWILYIEGGAWCESESECIRRKYDSQGLGSSRFVNAKYLGGILDDDKTFNEDFYDWNRVFVKYCDGSSFMSDVDEVDTKNNLTYRGARVFDAIMKELLAKGMSEADNAILTGGSAGGLSTILHCDGFRTILPNAKRVKCISDSGFFIHAKHLAGAAKREAYFGSVVQTHRLAKTLPESCTSKMRPSLCMFPEYFVEHIQTPLFLLESAFDLYQITVQYIAYLPDFAKNRQDWDKCTNNVTLCTPAQLRVMQDFRAAFIKILNRVGKSPSRGMYVHSCMLHGHLHTKSQFQCSSVPGNVLKNKTIGEVIGDWFFDRSPFHEIDFKNDLPRNCTNALPGDKLDAKCKEYMDSNC